jgi:hypothetical protein
MKSSSAAENARGLDRFHRVAAGVREPDDLGVGRLEPQQVRIEVLGVERMARGAQHLAAARADHRRGLLLQRVAEGVVGGEKGPDLAAFLDDRLTRAVCKRVGVVRVMDRVRRAVLVGQLCRGGARHHHHALALRRNLRHDDRHGAVRYIGDHVDTVVLVPFDRGPRADVHPVAVICGDDLHGLAEHRAPEVLDRHLRRDHRAFAADLGVDARHVRQYADADDTVGYSFPGGRRGSCRHGDCDANNEWEDCGCGMLHWTLYESTSPGSGQRPEAPESVRGL